MANKANVNLTIRIISGDQKYILNRKVIRPLLCIPLNANEYHIPPVDDTAMRIFDIILIEYYTLNFDTLTKLRNTAPTMDLLKQLEDIREIALTLDFGFLITEIMKIIETLFLENDKMVFELFTIQKYREICFKRIAYLIMKGDPSVVDNITEGFLKIVDPVDFEIVLINLTKERRELIENKLKINTRCPTSSSIKDRIQIKVCQFKYHIGVYFYLNSDVDYFKTRLLNNNKYFDLSAGRPLNKMSYMVDKIQGLHYEKVTTNDTKREAVLKTCKKTSAMWENERGFIAFDKKGNCIIRFVFRKSNLVEPYNLGLSNFSVVRKVSQIIQSPSLSDSQQLSAKRPALEIKNEENPHKVIKIEVE